MENNVIIPGKRIPTDSPNPIDYKKLSLEEKNLLHFLVGSNSVKKIFQYRLYSLILQDYIMMTYTKFNEYLKDNKDMESMKPIFNDLEEKIQKYIDIVVEWIDDDVSWIETETFTPLWDGNPKIYNNERLFLPYCLKQKMFYLIQWNEINATVYWQEHYLINNIPSFYQYSSQFEQQKSKDKNLIQTSHVLYPENTFQKIYDLKTISKPYFLLHDILYYTRLVNHSEYSVPKIYGFFYTEKNIKQTNQIIDNLLKALLLYRDKKNIYTNLNHSVIRQLPDFSSKEKNELLKKHFMPSDTSLQDLPLDFDFCIFSGYEFYFSIFLL